MHGHRRWTASTGNSCTTSCARPRPPATSNRPNDARVIQIADSGVAAASIGIPQRNMHTQVEIVSWADLENAVGLLVEFIQSTTDETDFRPIHFNR